MEKQIKMSLETARELYKQCVDNPALSNAVYKNWLLETFTPEELEGKKGFTWEESFSGSGFYLNIQSKCLKTADVSTSNTNKNVFKTKKQALSALAFAQLSHIVAKYNEGKQRGINGYFSVIRMESGELALIRTYNLRGQGLEFCNEDDALLSLEVNKELWEQYWGI
jgi:hypothetical protein